MGALQKTVIIIPCYNEELRLDPDQFLDLAGQPGLDLIFVDDGSTDKTGSILRSICDRSEGKARLLTLEVNSGKAEAVRIGMIEALKLDLSITGYVDADLATPVSEIIRLAERAAEPGWEVIMGARVALSGYGIKRNSLRHYPGRFFATAASWILGATIYDTQCGVKFFRKSPLFCDVIGEKFLSNWTFDVELLGRLLAGTESHLPLLPDQILEVPLLIWHDVPGSKLTPFDVIRMSLELIGIAKDLARRKRTRYLSEAKINGIE